MSSSRATATDLDLDLELQNSDEGQSITNSRTNDDITLMEVLVGTACHFPRPIDVVATELAEKHGDTVVAIKRGTEQILRD